LAWPSSFWIKWRIGLFPRPFWGGINQFRSYGPAFRIRAANLDLIFAPYTTWFMHG
jgi:hypothetical protein